MLRISCEDSTQSPTLKLEGKLTGPWVDEVERAWCDLVADKPTTCVGVDLSGVTFVDPKGKKLLHWMFQQGAELRDANLMTKYIVSQMEQGTNHSQRNGE